MPPVNSMDPSTSALESRVAALEKALQISSGSNQIVLMAGRSKITTPTAESSWRPPEQSKLTP
jgi:hypothetical protein